jgi:hypothetical protein
MSTPYNQPTKKASSKVNAAGAAPVIAALALGMLAMWKPDLYDNLPAGFELQLGLGLGGLIAWVAAYMRRDRT